MNWPTQTQPLQASAFPTTPVMDQATLDAKIMEWISLDSQLRQMKEKEAELRKLICGSHLFDPNKTEGTQTVKLGGDYALKCKKVINFRVENANYEAASALIALRNLGGEATERADKVLTFSARLGLTAYKQCSEAERAILDPIITSSPGMPTLEFVPPKP